MKRNIEAPKTPMCGWCADAAVSTDSVKKMHARCPAHLPCACRDNGHKLNTELATRMAKISGCSIEQVYERHGQKQRVLSDERKAALREQLARARAAKEAKAS